VRGRGLGAATELPEEQRMLRRGHSVSGDPPRARHGPEAWAGAPQPACPARKAGGTDAGQRNSLALGLKIQAKRETG